MNIRDAMGALSTVQAGISVASPKSSSVKKAWKYTPPARAALDLPCWTNGWTLTSHRRQLGNRSVFYTVHMQLYVAKATEADDAAIDLATAYLEEVLLAFEDSANRTLGGNVSRHRLRGNDPTVGVIERGGQAYIGLDLFLDVEMEEART